MPIVHDKYLFYEPFKKEQLVCPPNIHRLHISTSSTLLTENTDISHVTHIKIFNCDKILTNLPSSITHVWSYFGRHKLFELSPNVIHLTVGTVYGLVDPYVDEQLYGYYLLELVLHDPHKQQQNAIRRCEINKYNRKMRRAGLFDVMSNEVSV